MVVLVVHAWQCEACSSCTCLVCVLVVAGRRRLEAGRGGCWLGSVGVGVSGASVCRLEVRPVFRCCNGMCEMHVDGTRTGSRAWDTKQRPRHGKPHRKQAVVNALEHPSLPVVLPCRGCVITLAALVRYT